MQLEEVPLCVAEAMKKILGNALIETAPVHAHFRVVADIYYLHLAQG
jgi:hypothetical protein